MNVEGTILRAKNAPADVRYFQTFFGPQHRPNARMPIEAHRECGLLLKQVYLATEGRRGVGNRVSYARGTLDDWVMREYDRDELDMETLEGLYMPGPSLKLEGHQELSVLIARLETVKRIVAHYYPRGRALKSLLNELDIAIASIGKRDGGSQC